MDFIFIVGIYFIELIQKRLQDYHLFIPLVSQIFDPKYSYNIYFPIVLSLNRLCGLKMLYAVTISEYLNMMLKWIIQEDRPYWWVKENAEKVFNATIVQYEVTCETGPGSPSGHVMIATTVWFIVVSTAVKRVNYISAVLLWVCYFGVILLIAISRMFVAAHFPHQCILGFFIGIALGRSCMKMNSSQFRTMKLIALALIMIITTLGLYFTLEALNLDPNKSIAMAIKWCSDPSNVHLDTTPLFCAMRYTGTLLGLGVATFQSDWHERIRHKSKYAYLLVAVLGLSSSNLLSLIPYPSDVQYLYATSLFLSAVLQVFIARVGPEIVVCALPDEVILTNVEVRKKRE